MSEEELNTYMVPGSACYGNGYTQKCTGRSTLSCHLM